MVLGDFNAWPDFYLKTNIIPDNLKHFPQKQLFFQFTISYNTLYYVCF